MHQFQGLCTWQLYTTNPNSNTKSLTGVEHLGGGGIHEHFYVTRLVCSTIKCQHNNGQLFHEVILYTYMCKYMYNYAKRDTSVFFPTNTQPIL